jgi:hypothetical protein
VWLVLTNSLTGPRKNAVVTGLIVQAPDFMSECQSHLVSEQLHDSRSRSHEIPEAWSKRLKGQESLARVRCCVDLLCLWTDLRMLSHVVSGRHSSNTLWAKRSMKAPDHSNPFPSIDWTINIARIYELGTKMIESLRAAICVLAARVRVMFAPCKATS